MTAGEETPIMRFGKAGLRQFVRALLAVLAAPTCVAGAAEGGDASLWVLTPVARPAVPAGVAASTNPIDAFVAAEYGAGCTPSAGPTGARCCAACTSI